MFRLTTLLATLALLAAPAANAHELQVLAPGTAQLDLGSVSQPRLVHGTLQGASDELLLTLTGANRPLEVLVLVPDALPERAAGGAPELSLAATERVDRAQVTDEITGIDYLVVARHRLAADGPTGPTRLVVRRGEAPTRVAVLVADPDAPFAASDPERTPTTMLRLRAWAETPPAGTRSETPREADVIVGAAWYGGGIALLALLTAVWWVRSGRARARLEGAARAAREA